MALIVKIMSGEDMPDDDTRKSFRLLDGVEMVEFHRRPGAPVVRVVLAGEGEEAFEIPVEGNVYVMNAAGKTISSFAACPPDASRATFDDALIKRMVERFLAWKLPANFSPDGGVEFDADAAKKLDPRNLRYEPRGTNLFNYSEAEAMVRHMLGADLVADPAEFHLEDCATRSGGACDCNDPGGEVVGA